MLRFSLSIEYRFFFKYFDTLNVWICRKSLDRTWNYSMNVIVCDKISIISDWCLNLQSAKSPHNFTAGTKAFVPTVVCTRIYKGVMFKNSTACLAESGIFIAKSCGFVTILWTTLIRHCDSSICIYPLLQV